MLVNEKYGLSEKRGAVGGADEGQLNTADDKYHIDSNSTREQFCTIDLTLPMMRTMTVIESSLLVSFGTSLSWQVMEKAATKFVPSLSLASTILLLLSSTSSPLLTSTAASLQLDSIHPSIQFISTDSSPPIRSSLNPNDTNHNLFSTLAYHPDSGKQCVLSYINTY